MNNYHKTGSAYYDFCQMVQNSWTFQRMTSEEQGRCWESLHFAAAKNLLKGCYKVRWGILNSIYNAFLNGIGYNDFNWRESDSIEPAPLF